MNQKAYKDLRIPYPHRLLDTIPAHYGRCVCNYVYLHHDVVIINDTNFFYSFKIRYNVTSYLSTYLLLLGVSKSQFIQQKNSLA